MTIGGCIQQARKKAGMSQKELGAALGVSGSMIGQYENDLRRPKAETVKRIAEALGTTLLEITQNAYDYPLLMSVPTKPSFPYVPGEEEKRRMDQTFSSILEYMKENDPELYEYKNEPGYQALLRIDEAFTKLNESGIWEAVKRVEELTEIPKYQQANKTSADSTHTSVE